MKFVLGVDAAWSAKNPSGVALLKHSHNQKPELVRVGRSYEEFQSGEVNLDTRVSGSLPNFPELMKCCPPIDIIALDIPLASFPITRRREVDQALSREYGKYKAAVHSPTIDRPGIIATTIYEQLSFLGYEWAIDFTPSKSFFEVYPHASIIEMFNLPERFPYKVAKRAKYWPYATPTERLHNLIINLNELRNRLASLVETKKLLPSLEMGKTYPIAYLKGYEDLLDAVVCALTGYYYLEGQIKPFGNHEGVAWVPKLR